MAAEKNEIITNDKTEIAVAVPVQSDIRSLIYVVRGQQVMLDSDLAMLYQVETGNLNKAMRRNPKRFPDDSFCFQLTKEEFANLNFQNGISSSESSTHGGRRKLPLVYTEQGIAMLSAVLRSEVAIQVSIRIMKTFVEMRKYLANSTLLLEKVNSIEIRQIESEIQQTAFERKTEEQFEQIFEYISEHEEPAQRVFFEGQIYDAFELLVDLIRKANRKITLIDGYVDVGTLNLLCKKNEGVSVVIYTHEKTKLSKADIKKFNAQYSPLTVKYTKAFHDRFLILDDKIAYHIGASLKDAGTKCFAVNLLQDKSVVQDILQRLELETEE
ncbi:MAG: ORF6N domain-containing protein [Clostridiales bacterium]|nr:ORF6N domain-containing protein [Clostridiales bacterium]